MSLLSTLASPGVRVLLFFSVFVIVGLLVKTFKPGPPAAEPITKKFLVREDATIETNDEMMQIPSRRDNSTGSCAKTCTDDPTCVGFDYSYRTKSCYFKVGTERPALDPVAPGADVVAFLKKEFA